MHSYDFAIIKLKEIDDFPTVAKFIKLPDEGDEIETGQMTLVSGWGVTLNSDEPSKILRAVQVPIFDMEVCNRTYGRFLTDQMVCAGYKRGGKLVEFIHCFKYLAHDKAN